MKRNLSAVAMLVYLMTSMSLISCENLDFDLNENQEQTGNNENAGTEDKQPSEGEGETEPVETMSITIERVNATIVIFKGTTNKISPDIEVGLYWSKEQGAHINDCEKVSTYKITDGSFELAIEDLEADTKYYCYPYLFMNGVRQFGDEFDFKTAQSTVTITVDNVNISDSRVTFAGVVELDCNGGVLYSTSRDVTFDNCTGKIDLSNKKEIFTQTVSLSMGMTYYYCTYYYSNVSRSYVYGDVNSITTPPFQWSLTKDLSSGGTANCYVVSKSGWYKIKAVEGNGSESVGAVETAEVLWESFGTSVAPSVGDLVQGLSYKDGHIGFKIHDDFKEGNAVIAAKDADGNILWSWHIWFTDEPRAQVYYNNAGTMMDRNLGATSATPGDVGALGLLYQWGRKDPFLGSSSIHYDTMSEAESTIAWPSSVSSDSSNGTIEYATAHPTTFITYNSSNFDWYYTGSSSTDNTRWTTSESRKSIFDPCPAGWRVPDGDKNAVWAKAVGSHLSFSGYPYDFENEGMNFSGKFGSDQTIWYPASGYRGYSNGRLSFVGSRGEYRSASWSPGISLRSHLNVRGMSIRNDGDVYPSLGSNIWACGQSVRCFKDQVAQ